MIHEIGNPAALQYVEQSIPIVIERPWNHGDGGHVLFLDGHVEFLPYPGRFPMTVDFIEGLQQLDKLEEFPFAYDDTLHDLMRNGSPSSHPASNGF